MKIIITKNNDQQQRQAKYTLLIILLVIILTGTLVNSHLFISPSLAAFFLYTSFSSLFIAVASAVFLMSEHRYQSDITVTDLLFLLLGGYVWVNGILVRGVFNIWHNYIIISCLFFISLSFIWRLIPSAGLKLFTIISLLACIESLVCVLQSMGWIPTQNKFFMVTGTWINPNVIAMFLALSFPATLSLLFTTTKAFKKIIWAALVLITVALFLLKCRTALAGAITASLIVLNGRFYLLRWFKEQKNTFFKFVLLLIVTAAVLIASLYAYQFKKASADGRKLVWKLSLGMVAAKPFTGFGYGMFEREYNLSQAAYFKNEKGSVQEKESAAYVHMAYNEFLQNAVEGGVPGLLIFTSILAILLIPPLVDKKNIIQTGYTVTTVSNKNVAVNAINDNDAITAYAAIVAFTLMSLLNFTIQAIPVWCLFIMYASLFSFHYTSKSYSMVHKAFLLPAFIKSIGKSKLGKPLLGCSLTIIGICFFFFEGKMGSAHLQMKTVAQQTNLGNYTRATNRLKATEDILQNTEIYWLSYGRIAFGQKDYTTALTMFNKVKEFTSNPDLYIQSGNCYEILGRYSDAERDYLTAAFIEPSRMAPRSALMTIHQKMGDTLLAINEAKEIITMQPKVVSLKTEQYKKLASSTFHQLQTNRLVLANR